jgi:Na+(H+)/acetate symporter ActP
MRLHSIDLVIIAIYLISITLFGLSFRKKQHSLRDYFLAGRNIPWWAISLSIVAAETSTLTVIGTPGLAYAGDFGFLQVVFGYLVGRVVISLIFIPQYFRGEMFTAYQLIDRRFGKALHRITAAVFLVTRAAAEGVRVWAVAIVVGIALGTSEIASVAIVMLLTMIYTFEGGMAAVIWTDVIQLCIYVGGTIAGFSRSPISSPAAGLLFTPPRALRASCASWISPSTSSKPIPFGLASSVGRFSPLRLTEPINCWSSACSLLATSANRKLLCFRAAW